MNKASNALKMIEDGVKNIYNSDNFKDYLIFLSKFHNYSFNNIVLILSQCPNASLVAGYKFWKKNFNRYVNKGEKAIKILAPCKLKLSKDEDDEEKDITYFKFVNVFDVSQTSGDKLPEIIKDIKGDSDSAISLIECIKLISDIDIIFKDNDEILNKGAKGYYNVDKDMIIIDDKLDSIQKCKTLIHEYVHSVLHKSCDKSQIEREIEAEALAFVICHHFDIDTSDYSFAYIASYANKDFDTLKEILNNIQNLAHDFINTIEPLYLKLE